MYYLSERDRQIQKSINAKVRALPPIDTWRTNRRTFATGQATVTTAGEAAEDIATGAVGTINLYKGPLSAPTLLVDGTGGAGGGFSSGFSSGFSVSGAAYITIEAYNLTETPIWTGARVIVAKIVLRGGEPDSSGYVIVEHNSAGVIRATAPSGGVTAGSTANFFNVIPIDGIYVPTTADIYCPVDVTNSQVVVAERNYTANRWEADPASGNPAPTGDTVRVVRVDGSPSTQVAPVDASNSVYSGIMMEHNGTTWGDKSPSEAVWICLTNNEDRWLTLNSYERYVGWYIGVRIYNSQARPAYAVLACPTAMDQAARSTLTGTQFNPDVQNNVLTYLYFGAMTISTGGMRSCDPLSSGKNQVNSCLENVTGTTIRITKPDWYRVSYGLDITMLNNNQNAHATCTVRLYHSSDNITYLPSAGDPLRSDITLETFTSLYPNHSRQHTHGEDIIPLSGYYRVGVLCVYNLGTPPGGQAAFGATGAWSITRLQHTNDLT